MDDGPRFSISRLGHWRRRLLLVVAGLLTAVLLRGLATASQAGARPWKVGTDPTFPPFEYRDGTSGTITGFDVELIEALGKQAGHPIELVALPFDGIIPALQSRSIDAAISAITITAERARAVDFSHPYFKAGLAIVVRDKDPEIKRFDDLRDKRIAVQIGTTGAIEAAKVPGAKVSSFDSTPLALQELANGNADAVINDIPATLFAI